MPHSIENASMALGKNILASDVGGHHQLLPKAMHPLLFPSDDVGALQKALIDYFTYPERYATYRDIGCQYVVFERPWKKTLAGYAKVYEQAMQRSYASI